MENKQMDKTTLRQIQSADTSFAHEAKEDQRLINANQIREIIPENDVQLQQIILEPAARRFFPEIVRDTKLGNLGEQELDLVREDLKLASHLRAEGLEDLSTDYVRDSMIVLNTSGSRKGFQQTMQRSQFLTKDQTIESKSKSLFSNIMRDNKKSGWEM